MIGEKVLNLQGKNVDPAALQAKIEGFLKADGFEVQSSLPSDHGVVIQAKKGSWFAAVVDADRALTITVAGPPDNVAVRIAIGKWVQHLATMVIETLLISEVFLFVDVAESAWNLEVEDKLVKQIEASVG